MAKYYQNCNDDNRYYESYCDRDVLRVHTNRNPEWEDETCCLDFLTMPGRWALWYRLKAAWRVFWWGQETVHEIWLTRKKALALAEYIRTNLAARELVEQEP